MEAALSTASSSSTGNRLWQKSKTGCEEGVHVPGNPSVGLSDVTQSVVDGR